MVGQAGYIPDGGIIAPLDLGPAVQDSIVAGGCQRWQDGKPAEERILGSLSR
jgi:hypothetical protein